MTKLTEVAAAVQSGGDKNPNAVIDKAIGTYASNVPAAAGLEDMSALAAMPKQSQPKPYKG